MDKYAELRAALESGPTPGPWEFINHNNEPEESTPSDDWEIVSKVTEKTVCSEPQCNCVSLPAVCDGPYIAAANPHTISALLAERDDVLENGKQAVRWAPSSAHWSNELKRLFGEDAREGIDALEAQLRAAQAERDALREALTLALEYWADRQQRYKNRSPVWVQTARAALAQEQGEKHDNQD